MVTRKLVILTLSVLCFGGIIVSSEPTAVTAASCTKTGNDKSNFITGTPKRDVLCALGGDDFIAGRKGWDIIKAGPGRDTLVGNQGGDLLRGMSGNDRLFANNGKGEDTLRGGPGFDRCFADPGDSIETCERVHLGPDAATVEALTAVVTDATALGEIFECDPAVEACPSPSPSPVPTVTVTLPPPPPVTVTVTASFPPCSPPPNSPPAPC